MTQRAQMKLGALLDQVGVHPAAWLHPSTPLGGEISFAHFADLGRTAEEGKLDFIFYADSAAVRAGNLDVIKRTNGHIAHFEPVTLLSAVAAVTERVGLAATVSTSFTEPYNVARQFASLDHLSGGRVGWNVVTSADPTAASNYGLEQDDHGRRYQRANEFVSVVNGLWDSWADDAFVRDRDQGIFFDPNKMYPLNHTGEFYNVRGPLNIHRTPQGRPVVISAGGSDPGKDHAARTSEVVFAVDRDITAAKAFYEDQKSRLAKYGRSADSLKILTSLNPFVGRTDEEAQEKLQSLQARIHPDVGRAFLSVDLGIDLMGLPVDEPIPEALIPETSNRTKSYFEKIVAAMREENLSIRQLYERAAASRGGMNPVIGSPKAIADRMQEWFEAGACDGFMVRISHLPEGLKDFVSLVVPELQRRGLFRTDYSGSTLREHLGLSRPENERGHSTTTA